MPERTLDCEVMKGSAHAGRFSIPADPDDIGTLRDALRGWLAGEGWDEALWPKFELHVRYAGEGKIRRTVRP
jgi:hypothetical protein